ncbi:S1C family serine protease [Flavilitoribacter nigricans]|uniref:PDZ domain-containing protein n=1 Tax=Flavilitoribacter nigricans (strain ATCC 23147 / DSM 23189 / NBRC 102662 / NCIMB 1420 / SS-2) TaxID=1122177 RepID=A0A2D0NC78_FLAN2|nr:S1C family serine protease [Flavilitoribacter nigricans]PHN06112.1 hypothetical protein CRP01_14185 [Flavilitoribacter nigricans DSM 23189 = NBRC 102662]
MRSISCIFLLTTALFHTLCGQNDLPPLERALSGIVTIGVFDVDDNDKVLGFANPQPSYADIAYEKNLNMGDVFSNGSGFVIDLDGKYYIVTNAHVIDAASRDRGAVYAFSINRTKYPVRILGGDSFYDIAVLEFDGEEPGSEILPMEFSEQEAHLAQRVYAIGNPLGNYPYSITEGIISGKNRLYHRPTTGRFGFLQHTATLIWGNSGGPLVDENGKVVGVNTWIETRNKNGQNYLFSQLNFALEGQRAAQLVNSILENDGRLRRAYLGLEFASTTLPSEPDGAPFIKSVLADSPGYESLQDKTGYTVTRINGETVQTLQDIVRIMETIAPEDTVRLKLKKGLTSPEIVVQANELTPDELEAVARHYFKSYSDYEPEEDASGIALKGTKGYLRLERFKSAGEGENWASFEVVEGKQQYGLAGLGGMSKQGTLASYQANSLRDLGAIIRLSTIEGHLGATIVEEKQYAGTIRFYMEDDDFNEVKVLYY